MPDWNAPFPPGTAVLYNRLYAQGHVQAAIGSVPLALGLPCGASILSVSVLGILLTAAPGAFGIDQCAKRLLQKPPALGNPPEA